MSKIVDAGLHGTRGNKTTPRKLSSREAYGTRFVKKAGMWCAYHNKDQEGKTDERFWFSTQHEAENKLVELRLS